MQFKWKFDKHKQTLHSPAGWTITVREIAQQLQDKVYGRHDLSGPWTGWTIRGKVLKGPHGIAVTPDFLRSLQGATEHATEALDQHIDRSNAPGSQ